MSATVATAGLTRSTLQTSIYAWLHRASFRSPVPDFDAVPSFVALTEQDINLDLRARCMIQRVTQTIDGQYLPLPCDYLEAADVRLSTGREISYKPRWQMGDLLQQQTVGPWPVDFDPYWTVPAWGVPPTGALHYDIVGNLMEIWPYVAPPDPLPDNYQPYTVELAYYARQQLGPDDDDTTDVLTEFPGAYLWGSLAKSAPFLRDDDRIATWQQQYVGIIERANRGHERARSQGSRLVASYRSTG